MAVHSIKNVQKIPITLEQAWDFFSSPANLQAITPTSMDFRIISGHDGAPIREGQIIEYKVKPLFGIPVRWISEITEVNPPTHFVDVQVKGPYKYWKHEHFFKVAKGGVEMTDIIQYENPLWVLGELANILVVKRKLKSIFEYRFLKMEELFGKWESEQEMRIEIL